MTGKKFIEETGVWVYVLHGDIKLITSVEGSAIRQNFIAMWEIVHADKLMYTYDAYMMETNSELDIEVTHDTNWRRNTVTNYKLRG